MRLRPLIAIAMILVSIWVLETARQKVEISRFYVGQTPVTEFALANRSGPVVALAHGFAGSRQMMQGYALPLAQAGYRVYAFDFLGHGRNRQPMSGDVAALDGTTRLLVAQTSTVIDAVAEGHQVALVGHSMATDVLVRVARSRDDIGPIVLVSAYSEAIDADFPQNLLLIAGAWESGLRDFADQAVRMVDPAASGAGETVSNGTVTRRAVVAPWSEHVSVLHSRQARAETVQWLDSSFGRTSNVPILPTGWAIMGLLLGLVVLYCSIATRLPDRTIIATQLGRRQFLVMTVLPSVIAPMVALSLNFGVLPVLIADYLVLHLLVFGGLQIALLRFWQLSFGPMVWSGFGLLLCGAAVFGFALDRYAANFWPTPERAWIILAMSVGAIPYILADMVLTSQAPLLCRLALRASFFVSLGLAIWMDFQGLFFLIMIAPVLVLYDLVFGTMGRATARRTGPLGAGLALGLVLAWALGVSFPIFRN